jgi:hypothetical protein
MFFEKKLSLKKTSPSKPQPISTFIPSKAGANIERIIKFPNEIMQKNQKKESYILTS